MNVRNKTEDNRRLLLNPSLLQTNEGRLRSRARNVEGKSCEQSAVILPTPKSSILLKREGASVEALDHDVLGHKQEDPPQRKNRRSGLTGLTKDRSIQKPHVSMYESKELVKKTTRQNAQDFLMSEDTVSLDFLCSRASTFQCMKPKSLCSNHLWFSLQEEFAGEYSDKYTAPVQKRSAAPRASHKASTCESRVRHIVTKIHPA